MDFYQMFNFYFIIGIIVFGIYGKKYATARIIPYLKELIKQRFG